MQVSRICKTFAFRTSADIKISKTQLSKIIQLGSFGPLLIIGTLLNLFGTVLKRRAKFRGSGLALTNNEIKDIIKKVKSLENIEIFLKETTRKITSQEGKFHNFLDN